MAKGEEQQEQQQALQKRVALKQDSYYANATMVETTLFDIAILFGEVRPLLDANGQLSLVEMYARQVHLSYLHARGAGQRPGFVESARSAGAEAPD
ncbi:MAG: hypothetical protein FJ118_20270 [Deltaproteobacteria bacterium]|nr:hypothetical protein [Deltaproteobacteria bacterium]